MDDVAFCSAAFVTPFDIDIEPTDWLDDILYLNIYFHSKFTVFTYAICDCNVTGMASSMFMLQPADEWSEWDCQTAETRNYSY